MKTQISNLINGSEFTIRDLASAKYADNKIGYDNKPANGGTPTEERNALANVVETENPADMKVNVNGVELTLARYTSPSGKTWRWEAEITADQYAQISGKPAPAWTHKTAQNSYMLTVYGWCTVELYASDGKKKGCTEVIGEEFVTIL